MHTTVGIAGNGSLHKLVSSQVGRREVELDLADDLVLKRRGRHGCCQEQSDK